MTERRRLNPPLGTGSDESVRVYHDPKSPQWEDCKVCGGDHWTKDHPADSRGFAVQQDAERCIQEILDVYLRPGDATMAASDIVAKLMLSGFDIVRRAQRPRENTR